jgi:ribonuclease-3
MLTSEFEALPLFKVAMTHSSYCREKGLPLFECNERLEFLGDAVLKISISSFLFEKFPELQEGELTKMHSEIVANKTLAKFARKMHLGERLILGAGEEKTDGRNKTSLLSCAFEALLGAIFLEYGYEKAKSFLIDNFEEDILKAPEANYKALLQEYTQALDANLPEYKILSECGSAHEKTFEIGVYYRDELLATGAGSSKKEAQQMAAREALIKLKKD